MPYILHVTAITTVCFLFYKLLLQKETFYRLNRWTLTGCLAVSFTLPLLPVPRDWSWRESWSAKPVTRVESLAPPVMKAVAAKPKPGPVNPAAPGRKLPDLAVKEADIKMDEAAATAADPVEKPGTAMVTKPDATMVNQPGTTSVNKPGTTMVTKPDAATAKSGAAVDSVAVVLQWFFWLYGFGLLVFGGNFLLQIAVLLYQSYGRPVIRDGRFRIVEVGADRAPCSFGNTIFINPALYDWETYNQILIHEKVHISGRHTLDILLAEMAVVLQWFNPFAWLYRREVENNLEFLADASVLEQVERSAYQLSLLRVSAPHLPFSITNNYNQSLLKRRIVMMNSKRSSNHTVWKYFFLIPLLTGLVCALNKPVALGADRKNNGPLGGDNNPGRVENARAFFAAIAADTNRKPRRESSGSAHENRVAPQKPVLSLDSLDTDGEDRSAEMKMAMDQALRKMRSDGDVLVDMREKMNEQLAMAKLAQTDMMNKERASQQAKVLADKKAVVATEAMAKAYLDLAKLNALTNVDVNIGDIRMPSDSEMMEGAWFATSFSSDDRIQFELRRESENGSWNNSITVSKSEFNPYPGQGNVEFKLARDAGTIVFKGQFDGQEGFGHFRWTANEAYFNDLKQMGLEVEGRRMGFFTVNVKKEYVAMLQHYFPHLGVHEVFACAGNHIDADYIKYWQGAGLTEMDNPRTLIQLKSMHIDRAYADELKAAGYDHLEPRELIMMKSQHIDGAYIRSIGRGKNNELIPVRELVSYKSLHIDSGYIASLRRVGYGDLDRNQLMTMYNQRVTADFIKGFQDIGYMDLSTRDLVNLKVTGITPDYVKGFIDIGYTNIDIRQLRQLKDQHIGPADIKAWRDVGFPDISANQVVSLNNMKITPDFVREFNKIGFDHIPLPLLLTLKSTGVNADYISKMKEKGFVSKDLGKYIRLKNDFN